MARKGHSAAKVAIAVVAMAGTTTASSIAASPARIGPTIWLLELSHFMLSPTAVPFAIQLAKGISIADTCATSGARIGSSFVPMAINTAPTADLAWSILKLKSSCTLFQDGPGQVRSWGRVY